MNKIVITGYKGFIGKRLYNALSNDNNLLLGIDESYFDDSNWIDKLKKMLYDFMPNVIFHVGACSNTLENDVNYMMLRNYESTKVITSWSKIYDIPLIYSSSAANYGINNQYPSNLYGWSKYAGENYVSLHSGINLRYFNVYGPGEDHKGNMASIAYQMFLRYKNNEEVKLFPGEPKRDFIYVDDVVSANIYAYTYYRKLYYRKYYDVGSGESRTYEDIMKIMKIPYSYHNKNMIPKGYQFNTKSDSKLWLPGWKPEYNLERGLLEYKKYLENDSI